MRQWVKKESYFCQIENNTCLYADENNTSEEGDL